METKSVTLEEAGTHLAELIELVEHGGEVLIVENSEPRAKLIGIPKATGARSFGKYRDKVHIADDFDAPLPDEFWMGADP